MSRDVSEGPAIGHAIDVNTKSYDRIFGMLLGLRIHVSHFASKPMQELTGADFTTYEKIDIPREGNHTSPAHRGRYDYKFKAYAPNVFMHLRRRFGISEDDYLVSLTADYMMSELKTIGKSSAMFYYTWDGRYVLKTLTKNEMKVLRHILGNYYQYVANQPNTLICHFYGAYRSQTSIGRAIRFVIMNNVFPGGFQIHRKFDLKGSIINRRVDQDKRKKPGVTLKDEEFQKKKYLHVGPRDWEKLQRQLQSDTNFLSSVGVMDYSLLVGIHTFSPDSPIMHPEPGERIEILSIFTPDQSSGARYEGNTAIVKQRGLQGKMKKKKKIAPTLKMKLRFEEPIRELVMSYVSENEKLLGYCGGLRGTDELDQPISEIYFMGIIDFLQAYGAKKKLEHFFKKARYDKSAMSCVSPAKYATRMFNFLVAQVAPEPPATPEVERFLERRRQILSAIDVDEEESSSMSSDKLDEEMKKKEKKTKKKDKEKDEATKQDKKKETDGKPEEGSLILKTSIGISPGDEVDIV